MKKIFAAALILALFLSGCGFTEQLETVKEEYIDPAIERAQSGEAVAIENTAVAAPNVNTNRERLTDYVPFEAVYTRADGALIETLKPSSNYGRLLPFAGGLVTESGEIVLDPVCTAVTTAAYQTQTDTVYLDIYILENAEGMYAACGADGAWTTGFDYTAVLPMELGVLCIEDEQANLAVCYAEDGSVVFASESCGLDAVGASFERDILPGEIVVADKNGVKSDRSHCGIAPRRLCVFEFIYFARPDSVIDGSSVHVARQRAGAFLALEHPVQADIVIGVPDSGLDAAMGYARQSGIPYGMGFIKNKYIGRTFISPTQDMRENEVNIKLNPIRSVVEGKRVVLIDDSIVRGTTCRRTIDLLRKAGAKEIHMRVSAPPFVSECYYGTDIDDKNKLIANHHTIAEIAEIIGVDSLGYLSLSDVVKLADHTESGFCTACFGGGYPTPIPQDSNKDRFECKISEREKQESV